MISNETYTKLGARIKAIRIEKKLLQKELAEYVGKKRSFISELESGRRIITFDLALKISKFLNIDLNALDVSKDFKPKSIGEDEIRDLITQIPDIKSRLEKLEKNE